MSKRSPSGPSSVTGDLSTEELVAAMANKRLDAWDRETHLRQHLSYAKRTANDVPLLSKPEAGDWDIWTCPNSLRDTEVQANLQIREHDPTYESFSQPPVVLGQPPGHSRQITAADDDAAEQSKRMRRAVAASRRDAL